MSAHLPALIVILPLMAAALTPLAALLSPRAGRATALGAIAAAHACAWLALARVIDTGPWRYFLGGWLPPWGIEYVVDALSAGLSVVITLMALLGAAYAGSWQSPRTAFGAGVFESLFLLVLTGLVGIVLTGDLFNLYVFLEIASLAVYPLLASGDQRGVVATFRYLLLSTIAASFYLLGVGFLYALTGTLNMADLTARLGAVTSAPAVAVAVALMVTGLGIKLALFPLHGWLPDAYTYAPAPVIGFVAAVMTKVSAYALFRILYFVLEARGAAADALAVLGWVAAVGIVAASVMALVQRDIRRVLAYSSIGQLGYIVLGFGIGNVAALTGALLHVVNHAVMKGCLFLTAGGFRWRTGATQITHCAGIARELPLTSAAFAVAAIGLVGLPPTAGFFSKWYLVVGAVQAERWPFVVALVLSSLMSAVYLYRILERAYFGAAEEGGETRGAEAPAGGRLELPGGMLAPILLLAAATILLGVFNHQIVATVIARALPPLP